MNRFVIVALAAWAGCATTGGSGRGKSERNDFQDQFPSRETLQQIAAAPPPARLVPDSAAEVDGWTLAGPLPEAIDDAQHGDGSPWHKLLSEAAARHQGRMRLSESMHCVAHEQGHFFLAHGALPSARLSAFIAARCGSLVSESHVVYFTGEVGAHADPQAILARVQPSIEKQLASPLADRPSDAGIWFGVEKGRAIVMVALAERHAVLEPLPLVPAPDGTVVVQGELLAPADHIEALINRGHYGFGHCSVDPAVALPRFAVRCAADPTDAAAWLEIAAFPAGRVLGTVVARLLVWPSGAPAATPPDAGFVRRAVPAGVDPRAQLFALLNEVRATAGLPPVSLSARQSSVAGDVAPHYFASLAGAEPPDVADKVVLGLRAGWDIEGDIRSGDFAYGVLEKTDDLGRLLDSVLDRPAGRATLLDHAVQQVALGPLVARDQQIVALVASGYQMFSQSNHESDAQRILGRFTAARVGQHQPPPQMVRDLLPRAQKAVKSVVSGADGPRGALRDMLEETADEHPGFRFRGYVYELSSFDELTFPPELVHMSLAGVGIAVGHYRPAGSPWWRLIVYIVAAEDSHGVRAERPAHTM